MGVFDAGALVGWAGACVTAGLAVAAGPAHALSTNAINKTNVTLKTLWLAFIFNSSYGGIFGRTLPAQMEFQGQVDCGNVIFNWFARERKKKMGKCFAERNSVSLFDNYISDHFCSQEAGGSGIMLSQSHPKSRLAPLLCLLKNWGSGEFHSPDPQFFIHPPSREGGSRGMTIRVALLKILLSLFHIGLAQRFGSCRTPASPEPFGGHQY
jgi:hypothetical protein